MKITITCILLSLAAIVLSRGVQAQGFYDTASIQQIRIYFDYPDWDYMLDTAKAGDEGYIMAREVFINGQEFDSVGVKYKGNSSYNQNNAKNPMHIELDTYKSQHYQGYKDIKLSNGFKDPSFLREVLSYGLANKYMKTPLSNYAKLYINDEYIGLFSNSESITKTFVEARFGSKNHAFFKCNPVYSSGPGNKPNLKYKGADSTLYYQSYEIKSDYGWQSLIDLCYTLENNIGNVESLLNVNETLWMLAFDNILVNLDSYIGAISQNYYLYQDEYGIFHPVLWDLNECFGSFNNTGTGPPLNTTVQMQQMNHLLHQNDAEWPLIRSVLAVPRYKRMYLAHYKTMLDEILTSGEYYTMASYFHQLIDAEVNGDPNKLYSYQNFLTNITNDVSTGMGVIPGIAKLCNGRRDYVNGLSDFTAVEPVIDNVTVSETEPDLFESVCITVDVANANEVWLFFRDAGFAPFQQIQMFDDGNHDDGAVDDGVYGVSIDLNAIVTEYYVYAENSTIGRFLPRRAQKEVFQIIANVTEPTDVTIIINEFMASNTNSASDTNGDFDDWIELYNYGDEPVDMSLMFLSDSYNMLQKWQFSDATIIQPHSFLIVWADNEVDQGDLHASFSLSADGEAVVLSYYSGYIIDSVSFGGQISNISMQRCPDNQDVFFMALPTFNTANTCVSEIDEQSLKINEFMAANASTASDSFGEFDDWIELYNASSYSIDLGDIYLSDSYAYPNKYQFQAGTELQPGQYLIVWADGEPEQGSLHASFKLSASGEQLILSHASGLVIDYHSFGEQATDVSMFRCPNGSGVFEPGSPSFSVANNCGNAVSGIEAGQDIEVFPNPGNGYITVKHPEYINTISVFDLAGRLVERLQTHNTTTTHLNIDAKGVYMLVIQSDDRNYTARIVVW